MDVKLLKGLVRLMRGGDVTELEVDDAEKGLRIRLKRGGGDDVAATPTVQVLGGAAPAVAPVPAEAPAPQEAEAPSEAEGINSPMVGTFYRSSSPDADPFVRVGDRVEEGTVVCILEAMKVMNEIQAEKSGEIAEVLVENGEPVEFGQPLFLLR
ncbi:MAG: acetyl-CoA carboxylase, biotin carboxyl carrier protein [Deltaproteobacteria bacterium]|nr:acetyl-CoA carboxylase, biotin carboxyl carrier protein [Deltaproteobacteria bacterium]